MSAFMVGKEHIDLMVTVAFQGPRGVRPGLYSPSRLPATPSELGEMLVKENLSSIHARYPDTITDPDNTPGPLEQYWLSPYEYQERHYRMTVIEALSAIRCYEYQSCEHPEWDQSAAYEFCHRLTMALIHCLPGYMDAPWEWTEEEIEKQRKVAV